MRSDTEINAEIAALRKALMVPKRWNHEARKSIEHTIRVLELRMAVKDIENEYYVDETSSEFEEGDNELYNELMRVRAWLDCEKGYKAPSENL